jgi:septum formation protein
MDFPVISARNPLILASGSPRRKRLLEQLQLPFLAVESGIIEKACLGEPKEGSMALAGKKAWEVRAKKGASWILGADTLVVVDENILGKPRNKEEAYDMLTLLGGKDHRVITGFSILNPAGELQHSEAVSTRVRVKALSKDEIEAYILTGEPFGKAGGYAIQGIGAFMVEEITGSYTNVVGLPLCPLIKALVSVRALARFPLV